MPKKIITSGLYGMNYMKVDTSNLK